MLKQWVIVFFLLLVVASTLSSRDVAKLLYRDVHLFGETFSVPFNRVLGKDLTTLFILEKDKLKFMLNTGLTILKYANMTAFTVLCLDCDERDNHEWTRKGLQVIESKSLSDITRYAFRTDGPMSVNSVLPAGDKRRHSVHMYYREWIKHTMLEHKLAVFLADIDVCMQNTIQLFLNPEDVIVSAMWPHEFRKGTYSFPFIRSNPDIEVELNNGLALFTPTEAYMKFQRAFMGFMVHEVVANFGFAQTAFSKLMDKTGLDFSDAIVGADLVGKTTGNVTVRAVMIGYHPTGTAIWHEKELLMRTIRNCWLLPDNWGPIWGKAQNMSNLLELVEAH